MRLILLFALGLFLIPAYSDSDNACQPYCLQTVADGLNHPWSMAFLPRGDILVSERSGQLRIIKANGEVGAPVESTPQAFVAGQGGYFDIVLDPNYQQNKLVYLAFAHGTSQANATRVIKARLEGNQLQDVSPIFTASPLKKGSAHFGGRLTFLNDGSLLITVGDGYSYRDAAQNPFSHLGKVVRVNSDGSVPADNPFADGLDGDSKVFTYGHRNPQGLIYDAQSNAIYLHEHGPRGGDEVNILIAGKNYGWPEATYGTEYSKEQITPHTSLPGMQDSIKYWVPSIAPSGMAYYRGNKFPAWRNSLLVGSLKFQRVHQLGKQDKQVTTEQLLFAEIEQRVRDVRVAPNGDIYILTDSDNGKLIRISSKTSTILPVTASLLLDDD